MTGLSWRHALLALAVVAVWGSNFAVIKYALAHFPPFTFAVLQFFFAFLPAALLLKRPQVPWRNLAAYGLLIGVGQFGVLYFAMDGRISPGLASLVVQSQVFFTIGLAIWLKGEKLTLRQGLALLLAAGGLGLILSHVDAVTTPIGLGLVLVAALSWALGNMVQRATPEAPSLAFVVWASLFSIPPLLALALVFEGAPAMIASVSTMTPVIWAELLYQSFGNTLFGYAAWGWLLARHPAAVVSPWALLVPVFGLTASALALGEPLPPWKLAAAALVIGGLALNTFPAPALRRDRPGAVG